MVNFQQWYFRLTDYFSLASSQIDNNDNYYIYSGTSGGFYRISNNGTSWAQSNNGMTYTNIVSIASDPRNSNIVYAASNNGSNGGFIYKSTDYGSNWSDITGDNPLPKINQIRFSVVTSIGYSLKLYVATTNGVYEMISSNNLTKDKQKEMVIRAYPNPFNPEVTISFNIISNNGNDVLVKLVVYDVIGRTVQTIFDGYMRAGMHELKWDASKFASGVYFYRLSRGFSTPEFSKILLLK